MLSNYWLTRVSNNGFPSTNIAEAAVCSCQYPQSGFSTKTFCWLYQIWLMENIWCFFSFTSASLTLGSTGAWSSECTSGHTKTLENIGLRTEGHLYKLSKQLEAYGQLMFPANICSWAENTKYRNVICKFINNIDWIVSLIFWYKFEKIITSPINHKDVDHY